jgi:phosphohistidine phosphatase
MRHAKSSWDDSQLDDHDRPLAARGKQDAQEMGRRLAESGFAPDFVVSSSARRARKTAKRVLRELDRSDLTIDDRLYLADASTILSIIQTLDDAHASAAIVGHNPGLTALCELLSQAGIDNIPTMGVAHLDLHIDRWSNAASGCGTLARFDYPKKEEAER